LNLHIYDVAAGVLILTEAGGKITDFSNGTDNLYGQIVATNGHIHDQLLSLLAEADNIAK
jgi:myo-inositol-1(or 4)-monophosphatase